VENNMEKMFRRAVENLGTMKFSIVYGIIFSSLVNGLAPLFMSIMKKEPWSTLELVMYIVAYFIAGFIIGKQISKRIE
jgi:membrane protease YdiL (CAAX protease family)